MKKLSVLIMLMLLVIFTATNCKSDTKKETMEVKTEVKEEVKATKTDSDLAMSTYQCPMDCEKGKTYEEQGQCPVCKMDLKVKSKEHKEMKHAENCKCKEAGECTCEDGKCECKAEVASNTMECTHCEPGSCECKA